MTFSIRATPYCITVPNNGPDENPAPEQTSSPSQSTAQAGSGTSILLPSSSREQARANQIRQALRGPLNQLKAEELVDGMDTLVPTRTPEMRGASAIPIPSGSAANPKEPALKPVVGPGPHPIGAALGPIDCTDKVLQRQTDDTAHGFTDMVVSLRRGLVELKASLADGIKGDNQGYARRSMDEWTRRTYNVVEGNPNAGAHVETVAKCLYENWRPAPEDGQGRQERQLQDLQHARETFSSLIQLGQQWPKTGVKVFDQDTKEGPGTVLAKNGEIDAYTRFAYRINPVKVRKVNDSGYGTSRISLNFRAADGAKFAQRLSELVRDNRNIRQTKIMGSLNSSRRVDGGAVYLGRPSPEEAIVVDKQLSAGLDGPALRTAPPGMMPISAISSYAEYMPGTKSGHGTSRGKIVSEVVKQKLEGKEGTTASLMEEALARHGYDPQQPSLIKRG